MSEISQFHISHHTKNADKWYAMACEDVLDKLESSKNGLTQEEVEKRQKKYGLNKLPEAKRTAYLAIFLRQFKSSLVYVLLAAAIISALLGDFVDAGVILLAVVINVIIGFYQENKAESSLSALRKIVVSYCKVSRNGQEHQIQTYELVPGDIVFLAPGDKISADLRIIKANNLKTNEASLTGESAEIDKTNKTHIGELVIADQADMAFMGTQVTQGNGVGVVVATGRQTAIGHIAELITSTQEMITPLQHKLSIFARKISILVLAACFLIFVIGLLMGYAFTQIFITSIAIAVSAIPEGLLVAVTMILAIGMQRILKKKALVKHLLAAEILGSTSVICSDKTGTMTEGEMRVVEVAAHDYSLDFLGSDFNKAKTQAEELLLLLKIGTVCNNSYIENPTHELEHRVVRGTPTEKALFMAGYGIGLDKTIIEKEEERLDEIPFDSKWKFMMTLNKRSKELNTVYLKGAPEVVIDLCKYIYSTRTNDKRTELTKEHLDKMQKIYYDMSKRGLRVLACAYKKVSSNTKKLKEEEQQNFIFAGLVGIKDPIRPGIKKTISLVKQAGIRTIMITGDHQWTASAIAKDLGLPHKNKNILSGDKLAKMNESELLEIVDDITVYARVTPEDKLKIVKAWQDKGKIVAMTGDGINDAPALKKANIGISLGSGTDAAKETADIILLDNNFKTIVSAVKEGRVIFDSIKKVILYFLSDSFTEVIVIITSLFAGWPLPILASQIIWINLVDDTFPALALTQEPAGEGIMQKHPRKLNEPILDREDKLLIGLISVLSAIGTLFFFWYFNNQFGGIDLARTVSFTFLALSTLLYVFSIRDLSRPLWQTKIFNNTFLILGVIIGFSLQFLAIYSPFLQKIFKTVPLGVTEWLPIIFACFLLIGIIELIKAIYYYHSS
ncbi:MAG: HAD-IC family P-type ATPase [Candidatus Kuenenbacteria bacterium]